MYKNFGHIILQSLYIFSTCKVLLNSIVLTEENKFGGKFRHRIAWLLFHSISLTVSEKLLMALKKYANCGEGNLEFCHEKLHHILRKEDVYVILRF